MGTFTKPGRATPPARSSLQFRGAAGSTIPKPRPLGVPGIKILDVKEDVAVEVGMFGAKVVNDVTHFLSEGESKLQAGGSGGEISVLLAGSGDGHWRP